MSPGTDSGSEREKRQGCHLGDHSGWLTGPGAMSFLENPGYITDLPSFLCSQAKFWIRNQNRVSFFEILGSEPEPLQRGGTLSKAG